MAWVVDTCVLLDMHMDDPNFGRASAACLEAHSTDGLVLSPISFVEMAPAYAAEQDLKQHALLDPPRRTGHLGRQVRPYSVLPRGHQGHGNVRPR